jgi:hypothetical protein
MLCTVVAQKVMPYILFLGSYLFRMYEIHAQYNWMFPLHMLFFHIISSTSTAIRHGETRACMPSLSVRTWLRLREQERSWYREGMHVLVSRWRMAVDVDGDYVEK